MRVVVMDKTSFAQYDYTGVTSITKSGSTITIAGTVAGTPFSVGYSETAVLIVIVSLE